MRIDAQLARLVREGQDVAVAVWARLDGSLGDQETFAEHLENLSHTITDPDPATMHTVASTFRAHRSALFERTARLDSGDVAALAVVLAAMVPDDRSPRELLAWLADPAEYRTLRHSGLAADTSAWVVAL